MRTDGADTVSLDRSGVCTDCVGGEAITLNVATALPEPISLALLGAGRSA